jgi:hypothetical protein
MHALQHCQLLSADCNSEGQRCLKGVLWGQRGRFVVRLHGVVLRIEWSSAKAIVAVVFSCMRSERPGMRDWGCAMLHKSCSWLARDFAVAQARSGPLVLLPAAAFLVTACSRACPWSRHCLGSSCCVH